MRPWRTRLMVVIQVCQRIQIFSSKPSDSEAIIQLFNDKTKEITKTMANLHFSTIDLRNKLSQGCITNINPIITQVTRNFQNQGQGQVRVDTYPPAQMCWREIRGFFPQGDESENQVSLL